MPTSSNADPAPAAGPCPLCGQRDLCGGLGMVRYAVPVDDPRFGKLFRCPNFPAAQDQDRQDRLRRLSNLDALADKHFEGFELLGDESLGLALRTAQTFAAQPTGWLLLEGTYGCGKTHLAAAVGNARLAAGDVVLFITSPDLLDHLRASYGPSAEASFDATFDRVRGADLLILDDLGVENPSPWAQEKLFQLLNHRYTHHLPTLITTNQDVDRLDPRLRSRLLDVTATKRIKITATDYRSSARNEHLALESMLGLMREMRFDSFEIDAHNLDPEEQAGLQRVLRAAHSYAQQPSGWLFIQGPYGTGKTHLAAAIAHERAARGDEVMLLTVMDLMDFLRSTFQDKDLSFERRLRQVREVDLLVLDDLGSEHSSGWAREKLFQIIDYRYLTARPTVITTARHMEDLDERLRTRLLDDRRCVLYNLSVRPYVLRKRRGRPGSGQEYPPPERSR